MATKERFTTGELNKTREWLEKEGREKIPTEVLRVLLMVVSLVEKVEPLTRTSKKLLSLLRQAWDLERTSEKVDAAEKQRAQKKGQKSVLTRRARTRKPARRAAPQETERPQGTLASYREGAEAEIPVLPSETFATEKGATVDDIVSGRETVHTYHLEIGWVRNTFHLGTTTNTKTGKTLRPEVPDVLPGGKFTFGTMVATAVLHVGYQMPLTRIVSWLGTQKVPLAKSTVFGFLVQVTKAFLPIFFVLLRNLAARAKVIEEDDFNTRVNKKGVDLEALRSTPSPQRTAAEEILLKVDDEVGLTATSLKSKAPKTRANLTVLSGLLDEKDAKSRVVVKLTHLGGAGDLLGRLLVKHRDPENPLWIVSDLSAANTPRAPGIEKHTIHQQGCIWHARRRFWQVRDLDDECWHALRLFQDLAQVEERVGAPETKESEKVRLRSRYSKWFFTRLVRVCAALVKKWGKESAVGAAAEYVLANEHTLRQFLKHPFLVAHNNRVERYGRPEKLMLSASKFRDRLSGRIVYDVISTVMATCCANGIDFYLYAIDVLRNRKAAALNPDDWTPFAWSKRQQAVQK